MSADSVFLLVCDELPRRSGEAFHLILLQTCCGMSMQDLTFVKRKQQQPDCANSSFCSLMYSVMYVRRPGFRDRNFCVSYLVEIGRGIRNSQRD